MTDFDAIKEELLNKQAVREKLGEAMAEHNLAIELKAKLDKAKESLEA